MVIPGLLPRTLRGVGGIRLIDMPGVIYPESVLIGHKGSDTSSGRPHAAVPSWGISSRAAAEKLGVSVRSARALLNKNKAKFRLVSQRGGPACMYWDKRVVERLVAKRMPLVHKIPEKLCPASEACCILVIARSTLSRYVKMKLLREHKLRHVTPTGVRVVSYYLRAEVKRLAARKNAAHLRAEQARRERLHEWWSSQRLLPDDTGSSPKR